MERPTCSKCGAEFCVPGDIQFFGLSGNDLFKMVRWLKDNNATVKDLENSTLNYKFWNKVKIQDAMFEKL